MTDNPHQRTVEMLRVIRLDIINRSRSTDFDYERSTTTLHKHLGIARDLQDTLLLAQTHNALGIIEMEAGHLDKAEAFLQQGLELIEGHDLALITAILYGNLGETYRRQALYTEALGTFSLALPIFEPLIGTNNGWSMTESNRGWVYLALQDYAVARRCFENAQEHLNMTVDIAASALLEIYAGLAEVELAGGNLARAWFNANRAEEVAEKGGFHAQLPTIYLCQAHIAARDASQAAAALFAKCRQTLERYHNPPSIARFILNEALYQQRVGNQAAAQRLGHEARALFHQLDMNQEAAIAERVAQSGT